MGTANDIDPRSEIVAILSRYLNAIDRGDRDGVADCFTEDAQAVYSGQEAGNSRREVVDHLCSAGAFGVERWGASMHALANWHIELTGVNRAHSTIFVEALLA